MTHIYEMLSLSFAALPYRFLYLQIESPIVVGGLFIVKLSMKVFNFILRPAWKAHKNK